MNSLLNCLIFLVNSKQNVKMLFLTEIKCYLWGIFYLLLYQASSRSNISRKFFSSGRLNWSHWISPGSFSWRTNFLLESGSFIQSTASIRGFSSSFRRRSFNLDRDFDLGKLQIPLLITFKLLVISYLHTCLSWYRLDFSRITRTCEGCQQLETFLEELSLHPDEWRLRWC